MAIVKCITLLLIIAIGLLATGRSSLKIPDSGLERSQIVPKLEVVSSIPRYKFGSYHIGDVALLDNGEAWAIGYDGQHIQRVYHSKDRGKSWSAVDVPGIDFTLKAISFSDPQHGWAVGGKGSIIRTKDGGRSWKLLKQPTHSELHAAHFANSQVGYIAGNTRFGDKITDEVWGSVEILCTKDGGETWRRCYKKNEPSSVFQIMAPSGSEAFVALDGNQLIRTDNQGATWHSVDISGKKVSSIALAGDGALWVVGSKGTFERSTDGGRTWRHDASLGGDAVGLDWGQVSFNLAGLGIVVGESGKLAVTLDSGNTWQSLNSGIQDHLRAVRLQGNYAIILGATRVYSISIDTTAQK